MALFDYEGYDSSPFSGINFSFGFATQVTEQEVYVPPTEAIDAVAGTAAVASTTVLRKNKGWNSRARSIAKFSKGTYFDFSCGTGVEGCCLGIDIKNRIGIKLSNFSHALIVEVEGVKVYEDGEVVVSLMNNQLASTNIRIYLGEDNYVRYVVTTGTEVNLYTSQNELTILNPYIYGLMYSAGDTILNASYKEGKVQYGSA